jgi:tetratricopeptide (TPR) repeat protein
MADDDMGGVPRTSYTQNVTAVNGFAYGVIGADIHVFENGLPLYLLANWPSAHTADPMWLRELPSRMLNASRAVVPFTGRDGELADLRHWRDDDRKLAVLWLYGPGGQGKTRLAAQLAAESAAAGWKVAAAYQGMDADRPEPGSQDLSLAGAAGLLLIIDYADRWLVSNLTWLLKNTLLHQEGVRTRILMLARTRDGLSALDAILDYYQAGSASRFLPGLAGGVGERENMFRAARDSFSGIYGMNAAGLGPPMPLDDPEFGLTLAVHMAALVAVDALATGDKPPARVDGLTVYLLNREILHWSRLYAGDLAGMSQGTGQFRTPPSVMHHAVFAAALTGAVPSAVGSTVLTGIGLSSPETVLSEHARCYPSTAVGQDMVLEPLYPDRLAEDFLALTLGGHSASYQPQAWSGETVGLLLNRPSERAEPRAWAPRAITFLASAAQRWPHVATGYLNPLLGADPWLGVAAGGAALTALSEIEDLDFAVLNAIDDRLPERNVNLDAGMAALARRLAEHELAAAPDDGARADVYLHLGFRYSHAGLTAEALAVTQKAVSIYRHIADADPAGSGGTLRRLAMAVGNLGSHLSRAGRWEEAVAADEEAVAIRRRIVSANPALAVRPSTVQRGLRDQLDLADTLTNLGVDYGHFGRPLDAVASMEAAVRIFRPLRRANPDNADQGLARALDQLGNQLPAAGRPDDGLAAGREAVAIYRRLSGSKPEAHEYGLARALVNLSTQLEVRDQTREALASAQEAVGILRRLAKVNPGAFSGELAGALDQCGPLLGRYGHLEEARSALEEAAAEHRRRAAAEPGDHEGSLALTLSNMTNVLLYLDSPADALARSAEAVVILRRHADSAAVLRPLANALFNTGLCQTILGMTEQAQASFLEAFRLYRRLAATTPTVTEPDPFPSLVIYAEHLDSLGRKEDDVSVARNTVTVYHGLTAVDPRYEPTLARAQFRLGQRLIVLHEAADAEGPLREAVRLFRRSPASDPEDRDLLARSLTMLGIAVAVNGQVAEAVGYINEGIGLYRSLVAVNRMRYGQSLAGALEVLAFRLDQLGHAVEASAARDEAASIRFQLNAG